MFWGHGSSAYDDQFSAIKTATRQMMDETGIQLIISTGAAVHFCRQKSYIKDAVSYPFIDEIYGDGFHCSRGVGRYLGACTWFETIIKPIYGISVAGNTFRMLEIMSGESDASASRHFYPVDDIKAPILQQCAVEAAATPFPD